MAVKLENVPIDQIKLYEKNPRINDQAVNEVVKSIEKVGYRTPITVDENMVILTGHTRLKALKKMGWETIPFIIQFEGMTEDQKKAYRVLDNKTGELAEWDFDILKEEFDIGELEDFGFDLEDLENIDYSDKNKELDVNEFDDLMTLTLKYSQEDYQNIRNKLKEYDDSPELALKKILNV